MTTDTGITTTALPLAPGRWTLDGLHSSVTFAIRHLGLARVRGRFTDIDATLDVGERTGDLQVEATVALGSIDTGNADRDAHVRSPEFLDADRHPTMTFRSTGIRGAGDDWTMDGDLTLGGVTRPVSFAVEFCGASDAMGRMSAGFTTSGTVSRREHGIDFGPMYNAALGDAVRFDLDFEFHAPA